MLLKKVKAVSVLRMFKTRLRSSIPPAIFLAITYYFGWNAVHGKSGLEAQVTQHQELNQAQARYQATESMRQQWATKINDLSARSIQRDMLEEQARTVLNLADPNDLVIDFGPARPAE
jgi:cell division protein FtsB